MWEPASGRRPEPPSDHCVAAQRSAPTFPTPCFVDGLSKNGPRRRGRERRRFHKRERNSHFDPHCTQLTAPEKNPMAFMGRVNSGATTATRSIRHVILASFIGTAIEWYDFFLYGTAAALVFHRLFFPNV